MKKLLVPVLLLSLLLNAVLLFRKPESPAPPAIRTRGVEQRIEPEPAPEPQPRPAPRPIPEPTAISVPESGPLPAPAVRPSITLLASPTYVSRDGEITVTCTVLSGSPSPKHWIGLYSLQAPVSTYLGYRMISSLPATWTFKAPRAAGEIEFRYILEDNQTSIASSNPIRVLGDPTPRPVVELQSGTTYVKCGGEITALWSVLSGRRTSQDWIGLYAPGSKNEDFLAWKYVKDVDQGRLMLQAPDKPGTYEMRYLLDNGYESVATSIRIAVVP